MFSNELICEIIEYINKNINKEISIDELSMHFFFNKTYIMKRFKKELGITINQYMNTLRILNSLILYQENKSILSIAINNGFNSIEYYSEIFKKIIGVNPMCYKKFIMRDYSITEKEELLILDNVSKINSIKNQVNKYLSYRKPKTNPVKKLIFK